MPALTPSQTIGPFLRIQVPYEGEERIVPENDPDAIHLRGTVFDGEGEVVDDALIEIWQANRGGPLRASRGPPRGAAGGGGIQRLRALRHRLRGPLRVHHRQAGAGARSAAARRRRTSTSRCSRAGC